MLLLRPNINALQNDKDGDGVRDLPDACPLSKKCSVTDFSQYEQVDLAKEPSL